jgi:hypothetical protein
VDNDESNKKKNVKKNNNNNDKNKKKTLITIEEEMTTVGPYHVKHKKYYYNDDDQNNSSSKPKGSRTKREKELDARALESIIRKALEEIESEETTAKQKIDAGRRLLHSYGFEGNELQKSWKWLSGL